MPLIILLKFGYNFDPRPKAKVTSNDFQLKRFQLLVLYFFLLKYVQFAGNTFVPMKGTLLKFQTCSYFYVHFAII